VISRISPLETAQADSISFLSNPRYATQMAASRAACVVVAPAMRELAAQRGACIVAANPYVYFAKLTQFWKMQQQGMRPVGCTLRRWSIRLQKSPRTPISDRCV